MNTVVSDTRASRLLWIGLLSANWMAPTGAPAAGVTLITHGYNGNVDGWVTGMADQVTNYARFPGTSFATYKISVTYSGGSYFLSSTRVAGSPPSTTDSGEIIVKLDWSTLAGGIFSTYSTSNVAAAVAYGLLQTNLISELGGHALAELPLHLIGHSRGGSLISEISRLLGTNGVWVDHLTTLDPHPLNNDGFSDLPAGVDAPVHTYVNVLFHDNYWQNMGDGLVTPNGEPVFGAYIRKLITLSGGYSSTHSDVHLWYHGTVDWRTPTSDTEASLTSAERQTWWTPYESGGTNAGFDYSRIGGADRLSADQPVGQGFPAIRDGYNQWWDLGAGQSSNRTALTTNSGNWPSLIKLNRTDTNPVVQGQSMTVRLYCQWARPATNSATINFYLDDDLNPFNGNQKLLQQLSVPATGASSVNLWTVAIPLLATNAAPGWHSLFAAISGGGRTRYLYAPELVQVLANQQPPTLDIARTGASQIQIGVNGLPGQTIILQTAPDLVSWQALATNTLSSNRWIYTDNLAGGMTSRFYRARLAN